MVLLDSYSVFVSRKENYVMYGILMRSSQACGELLELFIYEDLGWDYRRVGFFPYYSVGDPGIEGSLYSCRSSQELEVPRVYLFEVFVFNGKGG